MCIYLFICRSLILTPAPSLSKLYKHTHHLTYFREKFDEVQQIGEGSFGEVFKARCKETGLYYAVKRSKERFRSDSDRWINRCTYSSLGLLILRDLQAYCLFLVGEGKTSKSGWFFYISGFS
jgi:serine/threonine protein kinase